MARYRVCTLSDSESVVATAVINHLAEFGDFKLSNGELVVRNSFYILYILAKITLSLLNGLINANYYFWSQG